MHCQRRYEAIIGGRKGGDPAYIVTNVGLTMELATKVEAAAEDSHQDLSKFFDSIPRWTIQLMFATGIPPHICRPVAANRKAELRLRMGKSIGPPIKKQRGSTQGGSWSIIAGMTLMSVWVRVVTHEAEHILSECPEIKLEIGVIIDDRNVPIHHGESSFNCTIAMQIGKLKDIIDETTNKFDADWGGLKHASKGFAIVSPRLLAFLTPSNTYVNSMKAFGVHISVIFTKEERKARENDLVKLSSLLKRIAIMPLTLKQKDNVIGAAVWSKLYCTFAITHLRQLLASMQGKTASALIKNPHRSKEGMAAFTQEGHRSCPFMTAHCQPFLHFRRITEKFQALTVPDQKI